MLNVKRKAIAIAIVAIPAALASAQSNSADLTKWSEQVQRGFFGSPKQSQSRPDSTIKVSGTTKDIAVNHFATVKIENDKGQSFVWYFDSLTNMSYFPLKLIVPSSFDAGDTFVTVMHPEEHFGS